MLKAVKKYSTHITIFLLCLTACSLYFIFFIKTARVEVDITVNKKTDFKIYWAKAGQRYSEKRMTVATVKPGKNKYRLLLTNIAPLERLRIDTHSYAGEVTLNSIVIKQEGFAPIILSKAKDFHQLAPYNHIKKYEITPEGIKILSNGGDPGMELFISPQQIPLNIPNIICRLAFISFVVLLVYCVVNRLSLNHIFVPVFLFGAWMLIITMAGISKENVHPDEYVHLDATAYYKDHWLPPKIDDPAISDSYSVYGISRLNKREIYYFFAGKFHNILSSFNLRDHFSMRLFNVFLFGIIFAYSVRNKYARLMAVPLLISPQLWYIFSYCNSDAFALFIAFITGCQLVDPNGYLNRFIKKENNNYLAIPVLLAILLGTMFLLKKNYYPFILFFYICLGCKIVFEFPADARRTAIKRLALISFAGLTIFVLRVGTDYMVNGIDKNQKLLAMQEKMAHPSYKPSTELTKKHVTLQRKDRGTTLEEMVKQHRWFEQTFRSSFGVFGYFTVSSSLGYYNLVRWTGVILLSFFLISIILRSNLIDNGITTIGLGLSIALIGASFYQSWTVDFQPQGRYLFPITAIFGIIYAYNHKKIHRTALTFIITIMFCLSSYFFIFEGLLRLPRAVIN